MYMYEVYRPHLVTDTCMYCHKIIGVNECVGGDEC
jgi:hypothetical protein